MFHYVLIVDDDAETRRQLSSVLIGAGYRVREAENGADALGLVAQVRPELVFLDMEMPVMDGWTFATNLLGEWIDVPTVVMTADGLAHTAARKLRAVGYLSKPFEDDEILHVMKSRVCGAVYATAER